MMIVISASEAKRAQSACRRQNNYQLSIINYQLIILLAFLLLLPSCQRERAKGTLFVPEPAADTTLTDLDALVDAGEIIVGTISGPETYYDYRGTPLGAHYLLAQQFANPRGLRINVQTAHNVGELLQMLRDRKIDLAAYPLPDSLLSGDLASAGFHADDKHRSWAVSKDATALKDALDHFYSEGLLAAAQKESSEARRSAGSASGMAQYSPRAQFISREKGIISVYDQLFQEAGRANSLDWRLLAAVAYTESAFDPSALSRAGARGLMQLMPATAASLGVSDAYNPKQNVSGGARLLRTLLNRYEGLPASEQISFALAAYNAGPGHIDDAQALASMRGRNPNRWDEVAPCALALSEPQNYLLPAIRHGYFIGRETVGYVSTVLARYAAYGGTSAAPSGLRSPHSSASTPRKKNLPTIKGPDDELFGE